MSEEEFNNVVNSGRYSAEKLNVLSQLLYVFAEPFNNNAETKLLLKKVMIIFDVLEQKHRFQSFDNISKRNTIYRYFENNHE